MIDYARIFYFVFGLITIGGGIHGFVGKNSKESLIAGSICGLILLLAGWLVQTGKITPGLVVGLVISFALAGRFLPKFFKEGTWWPAGVEGWLGLVAVILSVLALLKK